MLDITQKEKIGHYLEILDAQSLMGKIFLADFNNRLTSTLGFCRYPGQGRPHYEIHLNPKAWEKLPESERHTLLAHEICHATAHYKAGLNSFDRLLYAQNRGHGPLWQRDMRALGLPANRFYCGPPVVPRRRQHRYKYSCPCGKVIYLSATIYNRLVIKGRSYRCLNCYTTVNLTGKEMVPVKF